MITLKTLPTATEQEVFDQVATHLIRQCRKSLKGQYLLHPIGAGAYRGDGGLKCAAGCLIADDIHSWISGLEKVAKHHNLEFKIGDYLPPQTHVENI